MRKFYTFLLLLPALAACNKNLTNEGEDTVVYEFDKPTVLEYTPAPGQFINERYIPADAADAARWAQGRLDDKLFVSLGAFGGYIILKPTGAIENRQGFDFGIAGNPISTHNEPGIVWVSRDEKGDGRPGTWYELKGSESGRRNYSVTYYRTDEPSDVRWESGDENGTVDYVPAYHKQNYYPLWCDADGSFTLTGTLLEPKPSGSAGDWSHDAYGWGYADNLGTDVHKDDNGRYLFNRFELDNAVDGSGTAVKLDKIDFIKIQSAVLYNLGDLGDISTEVTGLVLLK